MKYAIVKTGGKQYRVQEGETLQVERLSGEAGDTVQLDKVLLVATDEGIKVGQPYVEDASVTAEILEHGKGEKVIAFRYKAKKNVRRRRGHRQPYTALKIVDINASGNEA